MTTPTEAKALPTDGGTGDVPVVHVGNVTKQFVEVTAVTDLNLDLYENEFVAVVGASGCGRPTLLSMIAGLEDAISGDLDVNGTPILGPGLDGGVVFQYAILLAWQTARENVMFALR